jgi:membrane-associated phospholipid phosphatase
MKTSTQVFVLIAVICLAGAASLYFAGPVPGDVLITRHLQALFGSNPDWAVFLTRTAKAPLLWGSLLLSAMMTGLAGNWRMAPAPVLAYGLVWLTDQALRSLIYVPKPDAALVAVAQASVSSGLPSTFGLVYGAVFGCVLWSTGSSAAGKVLHFVALGLIVAGAAARIILGGHWASQMLASVSAGVLIALAAIAILRVMFRKR